MNIEADLKKLCQLAKEFGAAEAKPIKTEEVVVRDWVRLKCQYGCDGYGKSLTCPPYSLRPEEFRRVLDGYERAILLKFVPRRPEDTRLSRHETMIRLEREAFLSGYYSAFGLACGPCPHCEECNLKECLHPELARPSLESCGIDVYATVRRAGFSLNVVKSRDEQATYFGLLLLQ